MMLFRLVIVFACLLAAGLAEPGEAARRRRPRNYYRDIMAGMYPLDYFHGGRAGGPPMLKDKGEISALLTRPGEKVDLSLVQKYLDYLGKDYKDENIDDVGQLLDLVRLDKAMCDGKERMAMFDGLKKKYKKTPLYKYVKKHRKMFEDFCSLKGRGALGSKWVESQQEFNKFWKLTKRMVDKRDKMSIDEVHEHLRHMAVKRYKDVRVNDALALMDLHSYKYLTPIKCKYTNNLAWLFRQLQQKYQEGPLREYISSSGSMYYGYCEGLRKPEHHWSPYMYRHRYNRNMFRGPYVY